MDIVKVIVSFVMFDGEVSAVFIDENGCVDGCYAHIGQHSQCSQEWFNECKQATPEEYESLAKELESIGYDVSIHDYS